MATALTYALGALLYFMSRTIDDSLRDEPGYVEGEGTWYAKFDIGHYPWVEQFVISLYTALTILSMVGYGDYYPVSDNERLFIALVMMLGVSYFSFLMSQSMDIINSYNSKLGSIDASDEINDWLF